LAGAHNYFHVPVALFGERTSYPGDFGGFEALSTDNRLCEGDVVILDAAPIFEGYTVDASLSWNWGGDDTFDSLDAELPALRHLIKDIAPHGLWAVEPHLATKGVGVKFEELLLIDDNGAQWLDDDLPHHRRWATAL
jgi:Xaa-Pro aminopeptidase